MKNVLLWFHNFCALRNAYWILFVIVLQPILVMGGGGNETNGARSSGVGGVGVVFSDGWAATNNPAGLALLDQGFVGTAYESRFFLPEAGLTSFAAALPIKGTSFGLVGHSFGYAGYSENRLGLSSARKLSDLISLGVQINVFHFRIGDVYGNRTLISGGVGIMVHPNERFLLAAMLDNPSRPAISNSSSERLPSKLSVGASYVFSAKVRLVAQVEKDLVLLPTIRMGMEYEPISNIVLRTGFSTLHRAYSFGLGYRWNNIVMDISQQWNQRVGFSATASLGYRFKSRKQQQ